LRALEHGLTIQVIETKYRCLGVDTPADLRKVEEEMRRQGNAHPKAKRRRMK
jgi:CMP-2-keto-3-deoxyoctulosonic acid synthetase